MSGEASGTDVLGQRQPAAALPLKLVVVGGPDFGRELIARSGTFSVGKDPRNELVLTDSSVSRVHLTGTVLPDRLRLTDAGSTNGSYYQGARFKELEATPGTTVKIGRTELRVLLLSESAPQLKPSTETRFGALVGSSLPMRQLFAQLERLAGASTDVLLYGETGTGKELCAEALHRQGRRGGGPFVVCDLGGVAPTLIESELFGHLKGAFTGAVSDRPGAFERADGGTLFLDEVGELPLEVQPRLLRALERREVKRVGGNAWKRLEVRVVSATHRDLRELIRQGRFREDLFHRLAVVELSIPPLRERREDIATLVDALLSRMKLPNDIISEGTRALLASYQWPGNVRELRNVVERVVNLGTDVALPNRPAAQAPDDRPAEASQPFKEAKEKLVLAFERDYLVQLLQRCEGNLSRAAREAQVDRVYLRKLVRKHGLSARDRD